MRRNVMTVTSGGIQQHWDEVYATKAADSVSWFQSVPETSIRLVTAVGQATSALVDIGAGASTLVDELGARGWTDLTVVDVSAEALRVRQQHQGIVTVVADVLIWQPQRTYDIWHDRAVFHFLTDAPDVRRYATTAAAAIRPGGHLVIGTFAEDGPTQCSGLPTVRYSPGALASAVGHDFVAVAAEREEHHTPWGAVQPFTWVTLKRT
jgi:2-polyprenyl-3-methyl-5-hydroxy-6-metoxy-1,4-benzoquinol methylase